MKKRSAFTLAEILIAVSIIAIMATLAIPALKKARLNANLTAYLADRKIIAEAIHSYRATTGKDLTNCYWYIDPVLHPYLPERMRVTVDDTCKAPFGGKWFIHTGNPSGSGSGTCFIGLNHIAMSTASEIVTLLEESDKKDPQTLVHPSWTHVLIYEL